MTEVGASRAGDAGLDHRVVEVLCREYALGDLLGSRPLPGTRNRNYVLETSSGKWLARQRYRGYCDPARIRFDHEVLQFLLDKGVPVPALRRTLAGGTSLRLADQVWEIHRFAEGAHLEEGSLESAQALGAGLARLHREGRSFVGRLDKLDSRGEASPAGLRAKANQLEDEHPDCAEPLKRYRAWLADAERELPDRLYSTMPHTLVHGDIQPTNVLVANGAVATFVDLDWCAWRPRLYDLAFALLFCCSLHEAPIQADDIWSLTQPARVDGSLASAMLDAYQRGSAKGLTAVEIRVLPAQIALTWCHTRISGALKVAPTERAGFLERDPRDLANLAPPVSILGGWQ